MGWVVSYCIQKGCPKSTSCLSISTCIDKLANVSSVFFHFPCMYLSTVIHLWILITSPLLDLFFLVADTHVCMHTHLCIYVFILHDFDYTIFLISFLCHSDWQLFIIWYKHGGTGWHYPGDHCSCSYIICNWFSSYLEKPFEEIPYNFKKT